MRCEYASSEHLPNGNGIIEAVTQDLYPTESFLDLFADTKAKNEVQSETTPEYSDFIVNDGLHGLGNGSPPLFPGFEMTDFTSNVTDQPFTSFANLPIPSSSVSTAAPNVFTTASASTTVAPANIGTTAGVANANSNTNANTNRCRYGCSGTFHRPGDLRRHEDKHLPGHHDCPVNGCDRKGNKAFYRRDKLLDHQRKKHRMAV